MNLTKLYYGYIDHSQKLPMLKNGEICILLMI